MRVESNEASKTEWTEPTIELLRECYRAKKTYPEIADEIERATGTRPTPFSLGAALNRFCPDERRAATEAKRAQYEANKARATELISTGQYTVAQVAEIMGESIYSIYFWVPAEKRPRSAVRSGFTAYLSQFTPSEVPDDPIVDTGKPFLELERDDCRWPIGKDADGAFRFCGCHIHRTKSTPAKMRPYCTAHAAMDVKPPTRNVDQDKLRTLGKRTALPKMFIVEGRGERLDEEYPMAA